jgi:uridine kinase
MNSKIKIIAVAGGSGSGKTYFARELTKRLGDQKSFVLYQDSYYKDQSDKFDFDGGSVNFDHPKSIDFELLSEHIGKLKNGKPINIPHYDFATHSRINSNHFQQAKPVIIVDGILILSQAKLRNLFDFSIFVHTPESTRYERRLSRDVKERGRTPAGVKKQFDNQVKPMHDKFVEPSKEFASLISSGTCPKDFEKNIQELVIWLSNFE